MVLTIAPAIFEIHRCSGEDGVSQPPVSLQGAGLKLKAWIEPAPILIITGQARVVVEIAASTWFTEGTRVNRFEVPDALVLESGQLETNFIRNETDGPWSVQQWTFFVYPLKEKSFHIPEIRIQATIADPRGGPPLTRTLKTRPIRLTAFIPDQLRGIQTWVAAEKLAVVEEYSHSSGEVAVGDAIARRVILEAEGIPAMLIPEFAENTVAGLSAYPDPPKIDDRVNRGLISARREERIVYVVEKPGTYRIPERKYVWYDLHSQTLQTLLLPEKIISAGSPAGFLRNSFFRRLPGLPGRPILLPVACLLSVLAVWMWRYLNRLAKNSSRTYKRRVINAMKNGDSKTAARLLFQWFDRHGPARSHWREFLQATREPNHLRRFDRFMRLVYGPNAPSGKATRRQAVQLAGLISLSSADRRPGPEKSSSFRRS